MEAAQQLYELQTLDLRIAADGATVEAERAKIQEPGTLRQARAALLANERQLDASRKQLQATEQEFETISTKKKALHDKLYGGTVTVPRELAALETEEAGLATTLSQLEDRELDLMSAIEAAEQGLARGHQEVDAEIARWRQEGQQAHHHIDELEAEVEALKSERAALAAGISPANLALYERLHPRKANRPVATVENYMCQACRVTLPSGHVHAARGADPPHFCDNCGRVLYVR